MAESCLICNRPLTEDQDCVTLTCLAREETKCHTTTLHDKCWEKKKKQLERQSTGKRIATTFFCLVDGCHNALKGQHTAARKVEGKVERQFKGTNGSSADASEESAPRHLSAAERRKREEDLGLLEEVDDLEGRCIEPRNDGTACGREIFDIELGCCKLHVEHCRKKRLLAQQFESDSSEKRKLAEAKESDPESGLLAAAARPRRDVGINMHIPDKAPVVAQAAPPASEQLAPPPAADVPSAPIKVAAWAAAKSGINQQKALDTSHYVDPDEVSAPKISRARTRHPVALAQPACTCYSPHRSWTTAQFVSSRRRRTSCSSRANTRRATRAWTS